MPQRIQVQAIPVSYTHLDVYKRQLMTCYDSENGKTFILGRKYLELERYFHKEIARVQAQWYGQQSGKGVKHPVSYTHLDVYKRQIQCLKVD